MNMIERVAAALAEKRGSKWLVLLSWAEETDKQLLDRCEQREYSVKVQKQNRTYCREEASDCRKGAIAAMETIADGLDDAGFDAVGDALRNMAKEDAHG